MNNFSAVSSGLFHGFILKQNAEGEVIAMAKKVAMMIGEGFEPIEVVAPVDCLRRAGADVELVSVMPGVQVESAQDITIMTDSLDKDVSFDEFDMLVVPGGSVGVENLKKSELLLDAIRDFMKNGKLMGSICAGPTVLNAAGVLEGRKATCYPGCEAGFPDSVYQTGYGVVVDGNLITASGPGQALEFGIALSQALCGKDAADQVASGMLLK